MQNSKKRHLAYAAVLLAVALACGGHSQAAKSKKFEQVGIASFYGKKFDGGKTASGEKYDMNKMTAAHRTLPFGTKVKVTRLDNGKNVVVRINDRGPFVKGRIIDLSYAAAKKLDMIEEGVVKVRIETVKGG